MDVALWIVQGLLAAIMLFAGGMKVLRPREELLDQMGFLEDFSDGTTKLIGSLEVLAAIGLILPGVTDIAPVLVPLAAVGVGLDQIGAVVVHTRRSEAQQIVVNVALIAMAAFIAWGRFGDYAL